MLRPSILIFAFVVAANCSYAQERKFDLVFGCGLGDVPHAGMNINITRSNSAGLSVGYFSRESKILQTSLDHKFNLAYSKKFVNQSTWYFGQRFIFSYEDGDARDFNNLYIIPSIGKHINLDERVGFNLDLGPNFRVAEFNKKEYSGLDERNDKTYRVRPSIRLQLFFKL
jgi:hypothetical protein